MEAEWHSASGRVAERRVAAQPRHNAQHSECGKHSGKQATGEGPAVTDAAERGEAGEAFRFQASRHPPSPHPRPSPSLSLQPAPTG